MGSATKNSEGAHKRSRKVTSYIGLTQSILSQFFTINLKQTLHIYLLLNSSLFHIAWKFHMCNCCSTARYLIIPMIIDICYHSYHPSCDSLLFAILCDTRNLMMNILHVKGGRNIPSQNLMKMLKKGMKRMIT